MMKFNVNLNQDYEAFMNEAEKEIRGKMNLDNVDADSAEGEQVILRAFSYKQQMRGYWLLQNGIRKLGKCEEVPEDLDAGLFEAFVSLLSEAWEDGFESGRKDAFDELVTF